MGELDTEVVITASGKEMKIRRQVRRQSVSLRRCPHCDGYIDDYYMRFLQTTNLSRDEVARDLRQLDDEIQFMNDVRGLLVMRLAAQSVPTPDEAHDEALLMDALRR